MKNTTKTKNIHFQNSEKSKYYSINLHSTLGKNYKSSYSDFSLVELTENIAFNNNMRNSQTKNLNKKGLSYTLNSIFSNQTNLLEFALETLNTVGNIVESDLFKHIVNFQNPNFNSIEDLEKHLIKKYPKSRIGTERTSLFATNWNMNETYSYESDFL